MSETVKLTGEEWKDLCWRIENEGIGYYLMHYTSADAFGKIVNGDKEAIRLFKEAEKALRAFENYLRLDEYDGM